MKSVLREWVRVPTIAERLGVSQGMIRALIRQGRLPARRLGRIFLIHNDEVKRLIDGSGYKPSQGPVDEYRNRVAPRKR
ncbi:MAG: excisionase family DNA-binding protein [Gemmataceae bacterium]